jgi:hypothetical protein
MTASAALPPSRIDATLIRGLEASKWLAVLLMVLSHLGIGVGGDTVWPAFWIGRVCAPIFCFVMVARLSEKPEERSLRYLARLLAWGIPAQVPFYLWLGQFGFHLNELVMWALGVVAIWLWTKDHRLFAILFAACLLIAAGLSRLELVAAPIMLTAYVLYQRSPSLAILATSAGYAAGQLYHRPQDLLAPALCLLTPVVVALCGLPSARPVRLPGWLFYAFYPVHIALIFLLFGPCPPPRS